MKTLLALALLVAIPISTHAAETTLVNRTWDGIQTTSAFNPSLSSDGRIIVFHSQDSTLVEDLVINDWMKVFAYDTQAQTTALISVNTAGVPANRNSFDASISANGRYVAFTSEADNLSTGDVNPATDIFVRDLASGVTSLVSRNLTGTTGNGNSILPSISDDGRFVAHESRATDLVASDTNDSADIFVFDRLTGATSLVSVSTAGVQAEIGASQPAISGNGRVVAFRSQSDDLSLTDTIGSMSVFKHELDIGRTTLVSRIETVVDVGGVPTPTRILGNGSSFDPTINFDGSAIAFATEARNLHGESAAIGAQVVLKRSGDGGLTLLSANREGIVGNSTNRNPSINADGTLVLFFADSDNLVEDDFNNASNHFLVNTINGQIERVDVSSAGSEGTMGSFDFFSSLTSQRQISDDGRFAVVQNSINGLVPDDNDSSLDVYLRDRGKECTSTTPGVTKELANDVWFLASLPCSPPAQTNTVGDIFADDITGALGSTWAIFTYDSLLPTPAYVPATLTTPLKSGQGFWIIQATGSAVTLDMPTGSREVTGRRSAPEAACISAAGCFELPLSGASNSDFIWNMIGNPYPADNTVAFDDLRVTSEFGACAATAGCTMSEAASSSAEIVADQFFHYNGVGYITRTLGSTLEAWEGYWVPELSLSAFNSPTIRFPR